MEDCLIEEEGERFREIVQGKDGALFVGNRRVKIVQNRPGVIHFWK